MQVNWRDALLIIGAVLAALTWFGVTPRKLSKYASQQVVTVKKQSDKIMSLAFAIGFNAFVIWMSVQMIRLFESWSVAILYTLMLAITSVIFWYLCIKTFKQISDKKRKIFRRFFRYSLPSLIGAVSVLSGLEAPIKAVWPLSGYFGVYGGITLYEYIMRKRHRQGTE
jgi:hypothetical protein